jgi:hypothetical protein
MTPFDFLNSINEKKSYLFEDIKADNTGEASDLDSVDRKYPAEDVYDLIDMKALRKYMSKGGPK